MSSIFDLSAARAQLSSFYDTVTSKAVNVFQDFNKNGTETQTTLLVGAAFFTSLVTCPWQTAISSGLGFFFKDKVTLLSGKAVDLLSDHPGVLFLGVSTVAFLILSKKLSFKAVASISAIVIGGLTGVLVANLRA